MLRCLPARSVQAGVEIQKKGGLLMPRAPAFVLQTGLPRGNLL